MGLGGISPWSILLLLIIIFAILYTLKLGRSTMNTKPKSVVVSILIAVVLYFFVGALIADANYYNPEGPVFMYLLYIVGSMGITYILLKSDISDLKKGSNKFKRVSPFDKYGANTHDFRYSFKSNDSQVITDTIKEITDSLKNNSGFVSVETANITDIDKRLKKDDSREFIVSQSGETLRGGKVSQLIRSDNIGNLYSIKWWFLVSGVITTSSIISFVIFSPISLPFWLISRLKGDKNLAVNIRDIYPAYYESHDLLTIINSANKLTMETLIEGLSKRGIDTSDLKMQQAQAMNISISGGKASFGSIVQGAMNNVSSSSGEGK